jgi:hypothetical protein
LVVLACTSIATAFACGCGEKKAGEPDGKAEDGGALITLVSPTSGPPGTVFEVQGKGFGASKGMSKLEFNSEAVGVKTWTDTEIVATVPLDSVAGVYNVTVVTDAGTSPAGQFTVE